MGNSPSSFDVEAQLFNEPLEPQALPLEGAVAQDGFSIPYRNVKNINGLCETIKNGDKEIKTMWDLFEYGYSYSNGADSFLGTRTYTVESDPEKQHTPENLTGKSKSYKPTGYVERRDGSILRGSYVWNTYAETRQASERFGRGLMNIGAEKHDHIGIFSVNRAEWTIASLGIYTQSLRVTPLYATLGHDSIEYIVNHAEMGILIVSPENLHLIKKVISKVSTSLKTVVLIDSIFDGFFGNTLDVVKEEDKAFFAEHDVKLMGYSDILRLGDENVEKYPLTPPEADDVAFLMYTSGTTGVPKGAVITHRNIISVVESVIQTYPIFGPGDTYMSFLPLAHILETAGQAVVIAVGGKVAYFQGDIRRLAEDLSTVQPSFFPGVPRVFSKFYQGVWAEIEKKNAALRWYINRAYNYQLNQVRSGLPLDETYDNRIFKAIRAKLGLSNIKLMLTGAAPCPPYLVEFMRIVTNAYFVQGYGMTECAAGACIQRLEDHVIPHCGPPCGCNDLMLADVPDMGYTSKDEHPRGEVLLSGPNIFKGYYNDEQGTAEAFHIDNNGRTWYRTGDIGRINPNGTLSIIDRKKNIIKLSQGEYVCVEKVEDNYGQAAIIAQIWCYGNAYKSQMIGVIVPNWKPLYDLAREKNWWPANGPVPEAGNLSDEFIAEYKSCIQAHLNDVRALIKEQLAPLEKQMLGFEKMKNFYIETNIDILGQGFTEEDGTLTPTMKKKRKPLVDKYIDTLKTLYIEIGEQPIDGEKW